MGNIVRAPFGPQIAPQAESDAHLIGLWLHTKSSRTQVEYAREASRFVDFVGKPLAELKLADVHRFADSLDGLQPSTKARITATVKSLLSFAFCVGYIPFNVGMGLTISRALQTRAQRIVTEECIMRIIALESHPTRKALLRVIYGLGLRVSETRIQWRDLQPRGDSGQVTVTGKGSKTRTLLMSKAAWDALMALRPEDASDTDYVFVSRQGTPLSVSQIGRIVKEAARRAGLVGVSPHWLRHAHASHALDRHCPLHVLQSSLGHQSLATTSIYIHARPGDGSALYLAV